MARFAPLAALLAVVAGLYVLTASQFLVGGDNAEFATLYATGGVAHPSGFPLYVSILRLFAGLPVSTPARGAALVTAGLGVAAVAALYGAALNWGAERCSALLAATLYALSPLVWDLATQAEVFTLNALLAACILFVCAPSGRLRGEGRVAALCLLGGLSLSNNLTLVLFVPIGLYGMVLGVFEARHRARALALGVAISSIGLSPYLFLMWQACHAGSNAWVWGNAGSFLGLVHHVLRRDYGAFDLTTADTATDAFTQLGTFGRQVFVDLLGLPVLIGLMIPCFGLHRRAGGGQSRRVWAAAALFATWLLEGPFLALRANVNPVGPGLAVVWRLYLLPELLLCLGFALGMTLLLAHLDVHKLVRGGLVIAMLCLGVTIGLPIVQRERTPTLENYLGDTLRSLPADAVVLGSGDLRLFGFAYAQKALGIRPDVLFISPIMLHYDWYRRRVAATLGAEISAPQGGSVNTVELARVALQTGRALFVTDEMNGVILRNFPSFPIGVVIRILQQGALPPAPDALESANRALFGSLSSSVLPPDEDSVWTQGIAEAYARPWRALAQTFEHLHQNDDAERCRAEARRYQSVAP